MFRKRYGWIAAISIGLMISGCGNNASSTQSSGVYQGKAIEGIASVDWYNEEQFQTPPLEPTVTEKAMYVADLRYLYAIDTKTGNELWTHDVDGMISRPAVSSGTVSFIDNAGVHALNADSGELLWEHLYKKEVPYEARPAEAAASSNHVFIPEQLEDGRITLKALDIKTGKESWSYGDSVSLKISPFVAGDKLYLPFEGGVHTINEKSGKELDTIEHGSPVSSVAASNKLLIVSDLGGGVTAYDLKSKQAKWSYENDGFDMMNRPLITLLDNKVLLTEVKNGIAIMLDASNGKELWSKNIGNPSFTNMYGVAVTNSSVADNQVYYAMWDDQQKNGTARYSTLLSLDVDTGNVLWQYQESDFIEYAPILVDDGMIVVTKRGIKAYKDGPNVELYAENDKVSSAVDEIKTDNPMIAYEGTWNTPGSDELVVNLSFTDESRGIITYFVDGKEETTPFKYELQAKLDRVLLKIGSEERTTYLVPYETGTLGFTDNQHRYVLERSNNTK
ncbi:PQQ-binding-like beta-propeller repeat protein [Paenibacillus sp. 1011MAR3C5]|uniref:outer membrane protein assembly factor BamB family protein n=1 Tax=Paenibacillus sp. 1011MAR3C5 TaxID=1675787 RepID=UPI0016017A57|nr:PQQ-binding-like beta-propeller repeat protein [Paenibacillus sp. 1011MAR3C5]